MNKQTVTLNAEKICHQVTDEQVNEFNIPLVILETKLFRHLTAVVLTTKIKIITENTHKTLKTLR